MGTMMKFEAVVDFVLSFDDGKPTQNVHRGDTVLYDGANAEFNEIKGISKSLAKVVGDWIVPQGSSPKKATGVKHPMAARNRTAGKIVEDSSPDTDVSVREQQVKDDYRELRNILDKSEAEKPKRIVIDDEKDMKPRVIDEDASIVKTVSTPTSDRVKNTSGVQMGEVSTGSKEVISQEERVAKETSYGNKKASEQVPKRLSVDREGDGKVVKKTSTPATYRNQVKTATVETHAEVSVEGDAVSETSYENDSHTDIGSSTQKQIVNLKSVRKPVVKGEERKKLRVVVPQNEIQDQDARVVRKVSELNTLELNGRQVNAKDGSVETAEGIISKVSVGPSGTMDVGDVTTGSGDDGIDIGDVQVGSGGQTPVEASDDDIDVDEILGKA